MKQISQLFRKAFLSKKGTKFLKRKHKICRRWRYFRFRALTLRLLLSRYWCVQPKIGFSRRIYDLCPKCAKPVSGISNPSPNAKTPAVNALSIQQFQHHTVAVFHNVYCQSGRVSHTHSHRIADIDHIMSSYTVSDRTALNTDQNRPPSLSH